MFFREKYSTKSKNPVLQLIENYRDGDKIKQHTVVSLGTTFNLPKQYRKQTAEAVEQMLLGQQTLWIDPKINAYAERIIKKIQTDGKWNSSRKQVEKFMEGKQDVAEVFVDQVNHGYDRILGPLLIGHAIWQRLGIEGILKDCGFNSIQIKTAEISVLDRLIAGDSEHAIPSWIKTMAVSDIIDNNAEEYSEDRFYRISDKLLKNKTEIEERLYKYEQSLFKIDSAIYLYDLTNTYFEGSCKFNPKAEYSKNQKEKRTDCPQIVVALVLDGEGFIRRHYTFKGTITDVSSLSYILEQLLEDFKGKHFPTIIIDRGVVSEENIDLLKFYGLKYIVASRTEEEMEFVEEFQNSDFEVIREDKRNKVEISLKQQGEETFLLCKSKARASKEIAIRNNAEERLEADLQKLNKLVVEGKRNAPVIVERSIGRLKERHSRVAHYYEIEYTPFSFDYQILEQTQIPKRVLSILENLKKKADKYEINYLKIKKDIKKFSEKYPDDFSKIKITIKEPSLTWCPIDEKARNSRKLDGNYLLKTNRDDLTDEQIWNMYILLTRIERAFRNLKTHLGLHPNYHQLEHRVDGHVFISILAYHHLHAIEYTLRQKDCHSSWATIKRVVNSHTYSTITLPTTNGTVIHLRKPGKPEEVHIEIYNKLNINYNDLKVSKILA